METKYLKHNYLAIAVAAVACFLFEAVWYSLFLDIWLKGIGHDRKWLTTTGVNPLLQWVAALLAEALIASAISGVTQLTGPQTVFRGVRMAALLWLGFVLPTSAIQDVFANRDYASFAVNTGFWLIGMALMGAIVGGWKRAGSRA
ncbi:MAG: DUF1761 domain-containing protein [Terracidiphilus sp.]|jgi:hypothetical protein